MDDSPIKIAFITFDSVITFYNITGSKPSMAVLPDIAKPYLPLPRIYRIHVTLFSL